MKVTPLPSLGALFETKTGARRKRERPYSDEIFYTVLTETRDDGSEVRFAYLAHAGGPKRPHRHAWGSTSAHTLVSEEPLTLDPSIGWQECCGRHGYVKGGVWEPTGDSVEPPSR